MAQVLLEREVGRAVDMQVGDDVKVLRLYWSMSAGHWRYVEARLQRTSYISLMTCVRFLSQLIVSAKFADSWTRKPSLTCSCDLHVQICLPNFSSAVLEPSQRSCESESGG